ncbi:radical SAM protein [Streptomyces silvensis]|uniref:Radical SAM protein n=1 Tax=Streptomyces silvensis TaxID=1765722 RepID=A0A0W7X8Q4_9ACTN|nr:radical SAM protein [Streptomyces silvensis]KUF19340.1 radical SAM protein [Streptomyces silvensis]
MGAGSGDGNEAVIVRERMHSLRNDVFHLILLPTEQCNFRCTYCYEDFSVGRMRPGVVDGVKALIGQRLGDLKVLDISWFGGEPLLAADIVEDVSRFVADAAPAHGLRHRGDVTTNGYLLTGAMVERLAGLGVSSFQVSLDGPEHLHDRTRLRADGRGSFAKLWQNLLTIRHGTWPVTVTLRVHLTPANLPEMPEFLALIRDTFLADTRFSVHLKAVERLGGPHDKTMDIVDKSTRSRVIADLREILRTERRTATTPDAPVCYAARPNSLMIRADGRLGKCTVSLNDPANDLGVLRPDGTLEFHDGRLAPWLRGWQSGNENNLACPADGFTLKDDTPDEPVLLQITPAPGRIR